MAKLIHPEGECAIARACESKGIMQGVSICLRCLTLIHVADPSTDLQ
jgi:hypothetical protein